jgi:hypothetical protein
MSWDYAYAATFWDGTVPDGPRVDFKSVYVRHADVQPLVEVKLKTNAVIDSAMPLDATGWEGVVTVKSDGETTHHTGEVVQCERHNDRRRLVKLPHNRPAILPATTP